MAVRSCVVEIRGAPAEHLARRSGPAVDLDADDGLEALRHRRGHGLPHQVTCPTEARYRPYIATSSQPTATTTCRANSRTRNLACMGRAASRAVLVGSPSWTRDPSAPRAARHDRHAPMASVTSPLTMRILDIAAQFRIAAVPAAPATSVFREASQPTPMR